MISIEESIRQGKKIQKCIHEANQYQHYLSSFVGTAGLEEIFIRDCPICKKAEVLVRDGVTHFG